MNKKELLKALDNVGDEAEILIATPNLTDVKDGIYRVGRAVDARVEGTSIYDGREPLIIEIGTKYEHNKNK